MEREGERPAIFRWKGLSDVGVTEVVDLEVDLVDLGWARSTTWFVLVDYLRFRELCVRDKWVVGIVSLMYASCWHLRVGF